MICPKYKITIDDDSAFCKHCGATLPGAGQTPEPSPAERLSSPTGGPLSPGDASGKEDVYRDPKFEKHIWQGRPAWRSYYGLWALWALASAVILGAAYKWKESGSAAVWLAWFVVVGTAVAILVREALFVLSLSYRLTTQRLFIRRGIIRRVTDQMELVRIDDVRLKQGLIDRLVNTGDVEVMGTDQTDQALMLESIVGPQEIVEALRLHVRGARSKGTLQVEQV